MTSPTGAFQQAMNSAAGPAVGPTHPYPIPGPQNAQSVPEHNPFRIPGATSMTPPTFTTADSAMGIQQLLIHDYYCKCVGQGGAPSAARTNEQDVNKNLWGKRPRPSIC